MNTRWYYKAFDELTPNELYCIMQLRNEVFVVEQNCVFQDADDKDQGCLHCMGWMQNDLAAYTRIAPPGYIYNEASIGRVVTSPAHRKKGLGQELMTQSIEICRSHFGNTAIKLGAQYYLKEFYGSFGFIEVGEPYLEDGIKHIYMLLPDK
jgi:ElaA protein